jgi:hypothetical protein
MTYNQVVKEINEILSNHPLIQEVQFNTPVAWINQNYVPNFPVASYIINSGQLNAGREQVYRIDIWLLDKAGNEAEFETEIISDMHSVAYDLLQLMRQQFNSYIISNSVGWSAVSEKFEDYLSGVKFSFDFSVVRDYGACDVPTTN